MKVDADDFRRVYQALNDEALLAVKRDELVEVARQCYDVELAHRGLTANRDADAASAPAGARAAAEGLDWVEVATFTDLDDARMARDLLAAAEIPSQLENAGTPSGLGGFRLSVSQSLVDQATEVLDTQISDEDLAAQAEAAAAEAAAAEAEEEPEEP